MPLSGAMSPIATHGSGGSGAPHERPSFLDASALSPDEFARYLAWVERIKPAHSRRRGLLDEHSAIKFLRSEFGISQPAVSNQLRVLRDAGFARSVPAGSPGGSAGIAIRRRSGRRRRRARGGFS